MLSFTPLILLVNYVKANLVDPTSSSSEVNQQFLMPVQLKSGRSVNLIFNMQSTNQPLCLPEKNQEISRDLQLLSHQVCGYQGFKTYQDFGFVHRSTLRLNSFHANSSIVECDQNEEYETVCQIIEDAEEDCQYYVSLSCNMCHYHHKLSSNSSLSVMSPLYPVLQPNNICDYDIKLDPNQKVVMRVEDFSLSGYQYSMGHDGDIHEVTVNL